MKALLAARADDRLTPVTIGFALGTAFMLAAGRPVSAVFGLAGMVCISTCLAALADCIHPE